VARGASRLRAGFDVARLAEIHLRGLQLVGNYVFGRDRPVAPLARNIVLQVEAVVEIDEVLQLENANPENWLFIFDRLIESRNQRLLIRRQGVAFEASRRVRNSHRIPEFLRQRVAIGALQLRCSHVQLMTERDRLCLPERETRYSHE
jgi:hypothetical protein